MDPAAAETAVLDALRAGGANGRELSTRTGIHVLAVREALQRLVASGRVTKAGGGRHLRFALRGQTIGTSAETKAVTRDMGPAAPTPPPAPAPSPANARLEAEIARALKSGASYDAREIRRNVLTAFPTISVDDITKTCDAMARDGRVFRHVVGESGRRYQLRVRK